jgi:hypothetical protein
MDALEQAAEQAVPADRFARKIGGFLKPLCAARSRRLNGKPLGGNPSAFHPLHCL